MSQGSISVALAGNPNCGKTTIFNNITGAKQHVGNYPGVTVERREGSRMFQGKELVMVDLPGIYSITANSLDELAARNVIINEKPDVIVNILDAANLERNLYLSVQLLEMERPLILGLNMVDVAKQVEEKFNPALLGKKLGVPVIETIGNRNEGTDKLLTAIAAKQSSAQPQPFKIDYGPEIEEEINNIAATLKLIRLNHPLRWLAIKLLENDQEIRQVIEAQTNGQRILSTVEAAQKRLYAAFNETVELVIAEKRYAFVSELCRDVINPNSRMDETSSDKIDRILTHRLLGLPIFLGIMWLLFNSVFTIGAYPQQWIEKGFEALGGIAGASLPDGDLKSLIVDGIIGGVGTVLSFMPNILILFLGIALLEDTGYMARAAFVMDRAMKGVGLHGKSFIPLLLGFGCNVPSIMGARTLENPKDRLVTILVAPLMSCSARLPVYTLLIAGFFSESMAGTVLFSIYFLGIFLAGVMAFIFRKFLLTGANEPFVMEMPPYHLPTLRSIVTHMWERSVLYVKKAGTLILAATIFVWFLTNYPSNVEYSQDYDHLKEVTEQTFEEQVKTSILLPLNLEKLEDNAHLQELISGLKESNESTPTVAEGTVEDQLSQYASSYVELEEQKNESLKKFEKEAASEKLSASYAGQLGKFVEPVIKPLGFDWKMGVGLISAVAAKEVLVSSLGTIYSVGDVEDDATSLQEALQNDPSFSPLIAYSLMVFTLLYSPCLAALAVMKRETNSWKWPLFSSVYSTVLAWFVAFIVYQVGSLLGY